METKKCKYCGVDPKEVGYEEFVDGVCPICAKKEPLFNNKVIRRKSGCIELGQLKYFAAEDDAYIEVTEWANEEGFDVEIYYGENKKTEHLSLSYVEYEAMVNIVHSFGSFEPVIYTGKSEN